MLLYSEDLRYHPEAAVFFKINERPQDVAAHHEGAFARGPEKVGPPALLQKADTCETVVPKPAVVEHLRHEASGQGDDIICLDDSTPRHTGSHAEHQPGRGGQAELLAEHVLQDRRCWLGSLQGSGRHQVQPFQGLELRKEDLLQQVLLTAPFGRSLLIGITFKFFVPSLLHEAREKTPIPLQLHAQMKG